MIKTFAYNEFNYDGYSVDKNKALEDIEDFIKSKGNLNYPIKERDKIIPAHAFWEEKLGVNIISQFFEKEYLESPGHWNLDEKTKTVIESELYDKYWYQNNYKNYSKIISEGFRKLCQSYIANPIYDSYQYKDEYNSNSKKDNFNVIRTDVHPLVEILLRNPHKEMIEVFIEELPNSKELLNMQRYGDFTYDRLINKSQSSEDIISSLFKHKIVDTRILIEKYSFNSVIKYAIYKNDFDFMNSLKKESNNPFYIAELDKNHSMYDSFLRRANTPEMAKFLIDAGCPIIKKDDKYDSVLFCSDKFKHLDVVKFILDYVPNNYMTQYENVFGEYLKTIHNTNDFKDFVNFIVNKGFPLEKYDLFNIAPGESFEEKITTCLELGCDKNNCKYLIRSLISKRDTSSFKAIQKTKLLNLYSPDAIFYFLSQDNHTKSTLDLIDKADINNINSLTSFGKPAWFAANNQEKLHKIFKKINSFSQLDSEGNDWITHYYSQSPKDNHHIASTFLEMIALEEKKQNKLLSLHYKEGESNLLHYGFTFNYKNKDFRDEFVTMIKSLNHSNLNELFSTLDEEGLFPIDRLIISKSNKDVYNISFWDDKLHSLLKLAEFNLDYDSKNKNGQTLYSQLIHYYSISEKSNMNEFIEPIKNAYSKYKLYNKLENTLTSNVIDNKKVNKI